MFWHWLPETDVIIQIPILAKMLRSLSHSGLARAILQRSSALPVFCKRNKSQGQDKPRGFQPQQHNPRHKQQQQARQQAGQSKGRGAGPHNPANSRPNQFSDAEERAFALKVAAQSLQHVGIMKAHLEQKAPQVAALPIVSALLAKTDAVSATMQAALDADPGSLSNRELGAVVMWKDAFTLAVGLSRQ